MGGGREPTFLSQLDAFTSGNLPTTRRIQLSELTGRASCQGRQDRNAWHDDSNYAKKTPFFSRAIAETRFLLGSGVSDSNLRQPIETTALTRT